MASDTSRDRSLITGRGGGYRTGEGGGGGASKVSPLQKGMGTILAIMKWGGGGGRAHQVKF